MSSWEDIDFTTIKEDILKYDKKNSESYHSRYSIGKCFEYGKVIIEFNKGLKISDEELDEEANKIIKLRGPNLLRFLGFKRDGEDLYVLYENAKNGPLKKMSEFKTDWMSSDKKMKITKGIARGLNELHKNKIIHRNLTLDCIFVDANDVPKISNYCFAEKIAEKKNKCMICRDAIEYITSGIILEQKYSEESDMHALGVLIAKLFKGGERFKPEMNSWDYCFAILDESISYDGLNSEINELIDLCKIFDARGIIETIESLKDQSESDDAIQC